ncbi:MAG TPA: hypothetical protein VG496_01070 [Myxococcales bacterium]|nr:hypothetical protein [Myxococcales bacterium]
MNRVVHGTSVMAAGVGALLSPLPLVDELVLAPAYGAMSWRIGRLHALPFASIPWRPITRTIVNGLLARAAANLVVAFVPGVAAAANAMTAAALTEWLGGYVDDACAAPSGVKAATIGEILSSLRQTAASFRIARNAPAAAPTAA